MSKYEVKAVDMKKQARASLLANQGPFLVACLEKVDPLISDKYLITYGYMANGLRIFKKSFWGRGKPIAKIWRWGNIEGYTQEGQELAKKIETMIKEFEPLLENDPRLGEEKDVK